MFGINKKLLPLETVLLESLLKTIQEELAGCIKKQISAITKIQRLYDGKEVNLYMSRKNIVSCSDYITVLDMDEFKFATVKFTIPSYSAKNEVDFWLVRGYLFSLNFKVSPKKYVNVKDIEITGITLHDAKDSQHEYIKYYTKIVEFLKNSDKFNIDEWSLFDEHGITTAKFKDGDYYVLAQNKNEPSFLLIKVGENSIYYAKHENKLPQLIE
jgi:hypothetical protein